MFCGETTSVTEGPGVHEGYRLRCRCWHCPECMPLRLSQLRRLGMSGHPTKFITLTVWTKAWSDPDEAARELVKAWRNVVQRAKRNGIVNDIEYLCVFETTEQGYPHLHILARCKYLPEDWLSERMDEYMQSPIVKVVAVEDGEAAARYVSKYVSKKPERFEGCKRYWRSRRYQIDPLEEDDGKPAADHKRVFYNRRPESVADSYMRTGWDVRWEDFYRFTAYGHGNFGPAIDWEWVCITGGPTRGPPGSCRAVPC